jgi:hypothetical protein
MTGHVAVTPLQGVEHLPALAVLKRHLGIPQDGVG